MISSSVSLDTGLSLKALCVPLAMRIRAIWGKPGVENPGSSLRIQPFSEFLLHGPDLFLEFQIMPQSLLDLFNNSADGLTTCTTEVAAKISVTGTGY
jgi:hypothetical protein